MTTKAPPTIKCPVCQSHGDLIHHDIRAPLVYSCGNCLHEWEVDPVKEPPQTEPTPAEQPPTPVTRTKQPPPRKL